jgi:tripartite motif-containing protein 71
LRNGKLLFVIFLFCFTCATYGVKKGMDQRQAGSPASVKALRLIGVVGERNLGTSSLYLPTGIAIDHLGNLFITDTGNDRVIKCDSEGNFLAETGGFGWEAGEFNRPTYIATDNGLNVYVVDAQNRRIQRFDQNLNFLSAIEVGPEDDFSGFGLLQGIAITPSGEIILSDMEGDYLIKLNSYLEYERTFGGFGEIETGLRDPEGISVSRDGKIFVADSQNHRIVVEKFWPKGLT